MRMAKWLAGAMALFVLIGVTPASHGAAGRDPGAVPDVTLTVRDLRGREQAPFKLDGRAASVLFFLTHDCPISNRYAPEILRIVRDYQPRKVRFYLVYVDPAAGVPALEAHRREFGLSEVPAVLDARHALVAAVGASVTPEVAVVGPQGHILYRGRIDDGYAALGKARRQVTRRDLRAALDAVLGGKKIATPRTEAIGCYINPQN